MDLNGQKEEKSEIEVKECFAYYGRAVYMMQVVEKGLITVLLNTVKHLSKARFDELLAEKFELTVGILKRDLAEKRVLDDAILQKLDDFHGKRDWLAHSYWWDRAIEFDRPELRHKIIDELDRLTAEFEELNAIVAVKVGDFLLSQGVDIGQVIEEFRSLEETPQRQQAVKLTKSETLVGIFILHQNGLQALIFELEGKGYWTLCEVGLTKFEVGQGQELFPFESALTALPVRQFNPRPKIQEEWYYDLDLKKDALLIKVRPSQFNGEFVYRFTLGRASHRKP
ncbi:hypothetical protein DYBT9275_03850 [Dyadobacter sp. CECT 9275]|uniref:Uncharacterized protein n=1 Tax=Dyadobacter helix TaxID=2822344 RepID=A0A916JE72_9BACT|nr:hypothetical protein [Dyadobacter sp. CECT 9275]CAG5006562.1 hypothetical protein DYBT9275_03850 [Dyadobacter sp. CECT 9275]